MTTHGGKPGRGKVRSIPSHYGWIDTDFRSVQPGSDALQHPAEPGVGHTLDIAHMVLYLCSGKAGFTSRRELFAINDGNDRADDLPQ